eukprot:6583937-Prymnesium_polylepis.2
MLLDMCTCADRATRGRHRTGRNPTVYVHRKCSTKSLAPWDLGQYLDSESAVFGVLSNLWTAL